MQFFMTENGNYIESLITISSDAESGNLTESEYNKLLSIIQTAPAAPNGYQYKLRADNLEWELVELPPVDPEPLTDEEALTRYANSLTGANDPDLISAAETLITKLSKED